MIPRFLYIAILAFCFISCGDNESKKLSKELNSSYDKDGKKVEIKGYIALSKSLVVIDDEITVELDSKSGQEKGELASIKFKFGREANQIYIPRYFGLSDLEIYDNKSNKHNYLAKVTITGTVKYTNKAWKEFIHKEIKWPKPNDPAREMKLQVIQREKDAQLKAHNLADERKAKTGDPNDYSFYIIVEKIEVK